jgi:hypothetical protein
MNKKRLKESQIIIINIMMSSVYTPDMHHDFGIPYCHYNSSFPSYHDSTMSYSYPSLNNSFPSYHDSTISPSLNNLSTNLNMTSGHHLNSSQTLTGTMCVDPSALSCVPHVTSTDAGIDCTKGNWQLGGNVNYNPNTFTPTSGGVSLGYRFN